MRKLTVITILVAIMLVAATPATRPVNSVDDVEAMFLDREAAAKRAYNEEVAKANEERLAGLQLLLSHAMKSEDIDQAVAIKKKIDEVKGGAVLDAHGKKVVYLCQASGSVLSVFGAMKQQMMESVNALDVTTGQQFNVIFFYDDQYQALFKEGTHVASPDNKKLAMDFIGNAVSTGGTQPLKAVNEAIKEKPDVLYVLTDGLSNMSAEKFSQLSNAFKQGNRDGKMKINCIFLQTADDPTLEQRMKQIAEDSHGTFKKVLKSEM